MKVDAVNASYQARLYHPAKVNNDTNSETIAQTVYPRKMVAITFKGGNKGDILHVCGECKPFNQEGGVATVVDDYKKLNNISPTEKGRTVIVTPYYNGNVKYNDAWYREGVDVVRVPQGLPDGHILKGKEGQPLYIKADLGKNDLMEVLKSNQDFFLLEEVSSKTMKWGMQEDAPIKLLKVVSDKNGKSINDQIYFVFTEATAFDPKPYSAGQYSSAVKPIVNSWNGDPYAKFNKATVEFMEEISKHQNNGFDPGTVVCSDSQAAYVTHYMAQKNAAGEEFFRGKAPMQIGHNLGDGYIGITGTRNMLINLDLMSPEELKAMISSSEYAKAAAEGAESESKFLQEALNAEGFKAHNKFSAISVATHYGNVGYLKKLGGVSQGYVDETVINPEIAPYLFEDIKELKEKGIFVGLTNPLNSSESAFNGFGPDGYKKEIKIKLADGTEEVIKPMQLLDPAKKDTITLKEVREVKRQNKINFLERFLSKYDNACVLENGGQWSRPGVGTSTIRAGMARDMSIVQNIDIPKYLDLLKKGKEDVKIVVSWGRGDFQKGFDETLMAFKKYVKKTGDKTTLLVMGGDLSVDKAEGKRIKDLAELMSKDESLKGRIMLIDGFAPGRAMAMMGDASSPASRFMPCELIDLESKAQLCTPIVPDGQGMHQKNFDPDIASEKAMADSFKTKHQYYSSRDELLKVADEETRTSFEKVYNRAKNEISARYKKQVGKDISKEKLEELLLNGNGNKIIDQMSTEYRDALRKLRDEVMSDEIADAMKRCLIDHRNDEVANTILRNQIKMQTGWENNQAIIRSDKPSAELYREIFRQDAKDINKEDVIGYGGKRYGSSSSSMKAVTFKEKLGNFFKKPATKWTLGIVAAAGIICAGYALFKGKPQKPDINKQEIAASQNATEYNDEFEEEDV